MVVLSAALVSLVFGAAGGAVTTLAILHYSDDGEENFRLRSI